MTMTPHIDRYQHHSLATIVAPTSDVVVGHISIDIHTERTVADQAIALMYPDALLSGAGTYDRAKFLSAINLLGASIDIDTAQDVVHLTVKSTSDRFPKLMKLVEVMLSQPSFDSKELRRVRSTTVNELHEEQENSKVIAHDRLRNQFFGEHDRRYTHGIPETIEAVQAAKKRQLQSYHARVHAAHWTCSIAGPQSCIDAFTRTLGRLKRSPEPIDRPSTHTQHEPSAGIVLADIPSRQNIDFSIGAPIPFTLHHADYVPLGFAIAVLAKWGGFTGRLMSTVREKEGLTYGIYGKLEGFTGTEQGYWRIMTFFAPEKSIQGLTSTFREITALYKSGISEAELERFKRILGTGQTLIQDSIFSQLRDLHTYHFQGFTVEEMWEHKARIDQLSRDEVNQAINTYLDPSTLTISGAGPTASVQKDLESFARSVA